MWRLLILAVLPSALRLCVQLSDGQAVTLRAVGKKVLAFVIYALLASFVSFFYLDLCEGLVCRYWPSAAVDPLQRPFEHLVALAQTGNADAGWTAALCGVAPALFVYTVGAVIKMAQEPAVPAREKAEPTL